MGNHLGPFLEASDWPVGKEHTVWAVGGQGAIHGVNIKFYMGQKLQQQQGQEKSALNVTNSPSLQESLCPNYPSYRLWSFTYFEF